MHEKTDYDWSQTWSPTQRQQDCKVTAPGLLALAEKSLLASTCLNEDANIVAIEASKWALQTIRCRMVLTTMFPASICLNA